jgi:predicted lipid-binding transport protein (Tim44 family)
MKRILVSLFALFLGLGFALTTFDAEARRMGGGKSFGMQRSAPVRREAAPQPQPGSTPAAVPQKRSWMGPLAGLAAGLGLGALMSHFGMGGAFGNMLLIALGLMAAFMLFSYFTRSRSAPAMQYAGMPSPLNPPAPYAADTAYGSTGAAPMQFPQGFDAVAFAREAKLNFIRMQTANDAGNIDDIRAFTTPELFAEIRLQLSERGDQRQETNVVSLDAEVIECAEENNRLVSSVRFHGLIREDAATGTVPFDEVWHLTKPATGNGGWMVAGIQQFG